MNIPGHLAIGLAQHQLPPLARRKRTLIPLLVASLFPDLVDKTIGYGLHLMPNGRHYAHNVFSLAGTTLLVAGLWGRRIGLAWGLGYLGHLLVDNYSSVPWLFPMHGYDFGQGRLFFNPRQIARESLLLLFVLVIYRLAR
ncbi:MAG TPA: metal-dependent hydrolase [Anaerolineae bacterium]|nr:metal-dependent hydrolase [Anaerolineae bacterium]